MDVLLIVLKFIVSISILNVWLFRFKKPTPWRGGDAKNLLDEFDAYGLSNGVAYAVGIIKVGLAILLLSSIYWEQLTWFAAGGIIVTMAGAIAMHVKIHDPIKKSLPAFIFLTLCVIIVFLTH
ncbi:DoxX family protein [Aureitalea marina]|uniref:DoxX family protein n=1 Tax=Aureitalea marina TaxID=930804 RepID=A0A2S7KTX4_9FLAO|nr:DoxX family protein [Aureitalea marina]PQB06094.1 hypothetical protein BST85_13835 [Aureitalea marina]